MRKFIFAIIFILAYNFSIAQTDKGNWSMGTSMAGLSWIKSGDIKSFSMNLTPKVGYFVANNFNLSLGIPISTYRQSAIRVIGGIYQTERTSTYFGINPSATYFIGKKSWKPYLGLDFLFYSTSFKNGNQPKLSGDGKARLSPNAGLAYFINQNVGLNFGLNYNGSSNGTNGLFYGGALLLDEKALNYQIGLNLFLKNNKSKNN
jgi:hypothetical protein